MHKNIFRCATCSEQNVERSRGINALFRNAFVPTHHKSTSDALEKPEKFITHLWKHCQYSRLFRNFSKEKISQNCVYSALREAVFFGSGLSICFSFLTFGGLEALKNQPFSCCLTT